jgi:outer membrane protein assembly factor BamE (lipoprotein component of BamABCDE complex)
VVTIRLRFGRQRLKNSATGRNVRAVGFWKRKLAKSLSQAIHPMNKKRQTINSLLAFLALACLTSYATAAELITQEKVNQIRPGQTTQEDLVRTFGAPATETVCPESERSLEWFYMSPISAQNYIPIIGPALGGTQVKAWDLWVVIGLNGRVKRYIAYGHYANGEVRRYIEYGHYPH